ncbi:MAG: DUF255 domain-containing protein [Pseudomonadota bacterium]
MVPKQSNDSIFLSRFTQHSIDWKFWSTLADLNPESNHQPIFLFIGHATCTWSARMAHEVFNQASLAKFLNENFFCVLVDKDDWPGVDSTYQLTHQILNQQPGGWPLILLINPLTGLPFASTHYLPYEGSAQQLGLQDFLEKGLNHYHTHSVKVADEQEQVLKRALDNLLLPQESLPSKLDIRWIEAANQSLANYFDNEHGGFYEAPKFPLTSTLSWLLDSVIWDHHQNQPNLSLQNFVIDTLKKMGKGGLFDHISGGFFHHCFDQAWLEPYFGKYLHSNAQLLAIYAQAASHFNDSTLAKFAAETAQWLLNNMYTPGKAFDFAIYSLDEFANVLADDYLWSSTMLDNILDGDEKTIIQHWYGWKSSLAADTKWHLHEPYEAFIDLETLSGFHRRHIPILVESARFKMQSFRQQHAQLQRDSRLSIGGNALTIKALLLCAPVLNNEQYIMIAHSVLDFIHDECLFTPATQTSYFSVQQLILDDYVFLLEALLTSLQTRWRYQDYAFCNKLIPIILERYKEKDLAVFYQVDAVCDSFPFRLQSWIDDNQPSAVGNLISSLLLMDAVFDYPEYTTMAKEALGRLQPKVSQAPEQCASLIRAFKIFFCPPTIIVLRGPYYLITAWAQLIRSEYRPDRFMITIGNGEQTSETIDQQYPPSEAPVVYLKQRETLITITEESEILDTLSRLT